MSEEKPSSEANITPPANEEPTMLESSNESTSNRPTGLIIVGFIVAAILILGGIYLALRGNVATDNTADSGRTETTDVTTGETFIPGEIALQIDDSASSVTISRLTGSEFMASADWATAVSAMPASRTLAGNVYLLNYDGSAPTGQAAVVIPPNSDLNKLDLLGWDGTNWAFIPSDIDTANNQLVTRSGALPKLLAAVQTDKPQAPVVATTVTGDAALPVELLPVLTDISAGTMLLGENGTLESSVATIPTGAYNQYLLTSNVSEQPDTAALNTLLADTAVQTNVINLLTTEAKNGSYAGVHVDYRGLSTANRDAYSGFIAALANALHGEGLTLAVSVPAATQTSSGWQTGAYDWSAIGQNADLLVIQLPLDPDTYADNGTVDQMLAWTVQQVDRQKVVAAVSASAVSAQNGLYTEMTNEEALANFGELQFTNGSSEVEPNTPIEVTLSGTASPLEWDGSSLTYKYNYEADGQQYNIWLDNAASLGHKLRLPAKYNLAGVAVRGLAGVTDGAGYATAVNSYLGTAQAPQPAGAAIVWTVRDENGGVLASSSGESLTFSWEGTDKPGTYTVQVEFALGDAATPLGTTEVAIAEAETVAEATPEPTTEPESAPAAETTPEAPAAPIAVGDADAVVNTNANVRQGPGLGYGLIAGGATAGTQVQVIGRNSDASWFNIVLPDGQEGWIFGALLTLNPNINVSELEVVEVAAAPAGSGDSSSGSSAPAPAPVVPPVANASFELGGQIFGAPYGLMSYSGMTWVKRQIKFSPGMSPDVAVGMITEAHNAGFKILLSIPGQVYPSSLPDFGAYTEFLRGIASLPDPPNAIEIWNEMNIDAEWPAGQISPSMYVTQMLAPAYNAIKGANSSIMVISGAPAPTGFFGGGCSANGCDDAPYVQGMAAAGAASYMDCIGIHYNEGIISPNQSSGDPRSDHYTRYFWGMVDAYYNAFGGSRQLCFTELGYLTPEGYGTLPGGFAWAQNTTVAQQAQWLAEAASLSANSGKVRLMIVWNMDSTTWGSDPQAGYAIIRPGGGCPACESLRAVMGQ